jgi:dephospho-CoA kinase
LKKPLQIGITGGIGSGKSLVCRVFHALGVPVYDADSRAKAVMTTDGILVSRIKKEFGVLSYREDGSVDREYLAKEVFNKTERLKLLNNLVHPRVAKDFEQWVSEQKSNYILKEAALLFEAKSYATLDKIIVVFAPEELRIKRVLQRDPHRTKEQIKEIIQNQLQEEEKLKRADFVIINDETKLVTPQVLELHRSFLEMTGSR